MTPPPPFLLVRSAGDDDLALLSGLQPAAVLTRPTAEDLRHALLTRPVDSVVVVGWEALRRGLPLAARQAGAASVLALLNDGSGARAGAAAAAGPDAERLAISESLLFADRILLDADNAALEETLRAQFPHTAGRLLAVREVPPPPDTFGPYPVRDASLLSATAARLRPPAGWGDAAATAVDASRAPLPLRVLRVLRRRGLRHVLHTVWQRLHGGGRRP
mgnify:CR=1 FL=1